MKGSSLWKTSALLHKIVNYDGKKFYSPGECFTTIVDFVPW